jgi:putative tryptophan/tyrosine transport system substrate-binding protein
MVSPELGTDMKRRDFIILLGTTTGAGWPLTAAARPTKKVGVVWHAGDAEQEAPYFGALHQGLSDLGFIDGKTVTFEDRFPNEQPERFASLAAELAAVPVDVLVAVTLPAALAAQRATATIPIVFILVPEPVRSKLVDSFARPGGNITGLTQIAVELSAKRLELLKEAFPRMVRVALLVNANDQQAMRRVIDETKIAATALGLDVQPVEVRSLGDFEQAFDKMVEGRSEGIVVYPDGLIYQGRTLLAQYARARHLPLMVFSRESLVAGALMSYGPDYKSIFRRAAVYVDKILKGEKPADLPVELPTKFEFFINLKTAKALGIDIQPTLLTRADEVIE